MLQRLVLTVVFISSLLLVGCDENSMLSNYDNRPPAVPSGVATSNGDGYVYISWSANRETDLAGYNVYYSTSYDGKYTLIGSTASTRYTDREVTNGDKYYYAIAAYDYNGNESELSYENVYGVARPEGYNESVFDYHRFPSNAGYDFSTYSVVAYNNTGCDFFFDKDTSMNQYYLDVYKDSDIKDMGTTSDISDITFAPAAGWSSSKDAVCIVGHTYVIWTNDNHFAKIRIKSMTADRIVFDWAYQNRPGEEMLKPVKNDTQRIMEFNKIR